MDLQEDQSYRVIGIDPGLQITGYGVIEFGVAGEPTIIEAGAIRADPKAEMTTRLGQIYSDLSELLAETKPDFMAVEQLYAHYKHPRTSIIMGHARGVIMLAAQQAGLRVYNLQATKVKKSLTGNGHASKAQMQLAIQMVCNLDAPPEPADVADALAIALCAGKEY